MHVQTAVSVGNGGEAWIGYKQDLRPCQYGLMMSIEPSFSVFYEGLSVVDYTQAVLTKNPMRPWDERLPHPSRAEGDQQGAQGRRGA